MSGSRRGSRPTSPSPNPVHYTPDAERQVDALRDHYRKHRRIEAVRNLDQARDEAERHVARQPEAGLPAPRPYPDLARAGTLWIMAGRYWFAYRSEGPPLILAVFDATADIPGRF